MITELRDRTQSVLSSKTGIACVALSVGFIVARWLDWTRPYVILLLTAGVILGIRWLYRYRRRYVAEHTQMVGFGSPDDTMEFPAIGQSGNGGPLKPRELVVGDDGEVHLVINKLKITRRHVFSRPVREMSRRDIRLNDSFLVSKRLAKRSSFEPTVGESTVFVFTRLHWWGHAPKQIGLVATGILLTLGCLLLPVFTDVAIHPGVIFLAWLITIIGLAAAYLVVWIPWYFTWLVITDQRIILKYDPPLWLEGSPTQSVLFSDVTTSNHLDQNGVVNWALRGLGQTEYGIIQADTAADRGDEWINQGIEYVRYPEDIKQVIDEQLMAVRSLSVEQHSEDMDYQRRQAEATEEMLNLVRTMVPQPPD